MIHEIQHIHISGIAIVHVLQKFQMKRIVHTQPQRKQMQRQRHIHIKHMMRNEVEVIVRQLQRHGIT